MCSVCVCVCGVRGVGDLTVWECVECIVGSVYVDTSDVHFMCAHKCTCSYNESVIVHTVHCVCTNETLQTLQLLVYTTSSHLDDHAPLSPVKNLLLPFHRWITTASSFLC